MVFRCGEWSVAPFICYDLRFPELFRCAALRHQPELYVVIANWPEKRITHWVRLLQARAIENQAYVVGVNRVGNDPKNAYPGRSVVIDPKGNTLLDAGGAVGCFHCDIEPQIVREYRAGFPALADIRLI